MLNSIEPAGHDVSVWIGLVDSVPQSAEIARAYLEHRPGQVVEWLENVGYNRAINRLGTLGHHPVIGCLNADVILTPTAIPELVVAVTENDDWGIVGPRQIDRHGRLTAGGIFGTDTQPRHRGWKALRGFNDVRDDAIYAAGSAVFLRRAVWNELTACLTYQNACPEPGPWLDTEHFYGDAWLSLHARAHDYKVVYLGSTTITHLLGAKMNKTRDRADKERFRDAANAHGLDHE